MLPTKLRTRPIARFVCTVIDSVSHLTPIKQSEADGRQVTKVEYFDQESENCDWGAEGKTCNIEVKGN